MAAARKIFFSLVLLLMLFGGAELALRIRHRIKYGSWSIAEYTDPNLRNGYAVHPYLRHVMQPNGEFTFSGNAVRTNSWGYRGHEIAVPKPEGMFRVVCLGGSTTFGVGVEEYALAWPSLLEQKLRAVFPGRAVEVVNMAVPGYNTMDNVVALSLIGLSLQPDLVIIYHGINDIQTMADPRFKPDYSHFEKIGFHPGASLLLYKLRDLAQELKKDGGKSADLRAQASQDQPSPWLQRKFERNLRHLIVLAQSQNCRVLLATFALSFNDLSQQKALESHAGNWYWYAKTLSLKGLLAAQDTVNQTVRLLGETLQVPCADIAATVPPGPEYFTDLVHFTKQGEAIVADAFVQTILQEHLAEPEPGH